MKLSAEQRRYLERAVLQYTESLDEAADWLGARGIDLDHARSSGLGVVTDPLPGHEHLDGRLAIPYLTDAGPVNMSFRCIRCEKCKGHGKYMQSKGLKTNLYGVQSIRHADDWMVVCEGELDALIWQQIGVPAIGISGAEKWMPHWSSVLEDFSRVYVAEDGDEAGRHLWDRISSEISNAIRMRMPDGHDTNSAFLEWGAEYLIGRIKK